MKNKTDSNNSQDINIEERFYNRVHKSSYKDCWPWLGTVTKQGYGSIQIDGKNILAHRLSYLVHKGIIKEKHVIDHTCCNKSCVNPSHLEQVTAQQNTIRYQNKRRRN